MLDAAAAAAAVAGLAASLGVDRLRAAWGIHEVANLDMENAIRLVSVNRGFDPRSHALVCLGGGGPVHGPRLARALGVRVAVVPRAASGGSARGLLEASASVELTRTARLRLDDADAGPRCKSILNDLVEQAGASSFGAGGDVTAVCTLGMRYRGQGYEFLVPIDVATADPPRIAEAFHERYRQAYGYAEVEHPVEVVTWHIALVRSRAGRSPTPERRGGDRRGVPARRTVYFPETGLVDVDVHRRSDLRPGDTAPGPCLVSEMTTTTVVLPGDTVEVAADESLLVHVGQAE